MSRKNTTAYGLTGGATGSLDSVLSTSLTDNGLALTIDTGKVYLHYYSTSSALAESSPDVIKPDNLGVGDSGRWLLLDVWTGLAALDAIGALIPAANKMPYFTSASAASLADLTAAARTLLALSATAGDIVYASGANTWANLAKGTANQVFKMNSGATAPEYGSSVVVGTSVASTSGVAIDFTSIPSWTKKITITLSGVSTNGTSAIIAQIGDSGGIEASGYLAGFGLASAAGGNGYASTTYFPLTWSTNAADRTANGFIQLSLLDAATFTWAACGVVYQSTADYVGSIGGAKALSAALDRVRITMANGTDAFDAGIVNILYE